MEWSPLQQQRGVEMKYIQMVLGRGLSEEGKKDQKKRDRRRADRLAIGGKRLKRSGVCRMWWPLS